MPVTRKTILETLVCTFFLLSSYPVFAQNGQAVNKSVPSKHNSKAVGTNSANPNDADTGSQVKAFAAPPLQQGNGSAEQTSATSTKKKNFWQWLRENGYDLPLGIVISVLLVIPGIVVSFRLANRNKRSPYKWGKK